MEKVLKPITVIIPNYNGAHLLKRNLPSVIKFAAEFHSESKVVVVDDGSRDDSLAVLEQEFPMVRVVVHEKNKGFAEAIHSGVNAAETELVFLLNSDVELVEDVFTPLLQYFDNDTTFSVCPLIENEKGQVSKHSWNHRQMIRGRLKMRAWALENALEQRKNEKLLTLYSSGGSMMVRRSMFQALKGFHPIFKPFYSEDFDLGLRAWSRGWLSYFEPAVHVVHQDKGSIEENEKTKNIKMVKRRNRYFVEWIHFSILRLVFSTLPVSFLQLVGELITFDWKNIKGFVMALRQLPQVYSARRAVKKYRILTLRETIKLIEDSKKA